MSTKPPKQSSEGGLLTFAQKKRILELLQRREEIEAQSLFYRIFPDQNTPWSGPSILDGLIEPGQMLYSREGYTKHLEFFDAGREHRERCFMAANRIGKTLSAGGFELACHLSGDYPEWWTGRVFDGPISAWTAGDTYETTRDILQLNLLGQLTWRDNRKRMDGRGIIPGDLLGIPTWRSGVQNLVDTIPVKHRKSGKWSTLSLKSYDQGRKAFQGTGKHVILFDEEPPMEVYNEALIRTATLNGITMLTFTPLSGLSEVVLSFLPADQRPDIAA